MLAVLVFSGLEFSCSSRPAGVKNDAKVAANFSLKDASGADIKLADDKGKVVLLNFWATWCGPCKIEIPWFIEFNKTYKDRGFSVLGVSMDDDGWKSVKPYVTEKKVKIAFVHMGLVGKDTYQKEILSLLNDRSTVAMR